MIRRRIAFLIGVLIVLFAGIAWFYFKVMVWPLFRAAYAGWAGN